MTTQVKVRCKKGHCLTKKNEDLTGHEGGKADMITAKFEAWKKLTAVQEIWSCQSILNEF